MGRIVGLAFNKAPVNEELFSCLFCDREYKSEEALEKHIASKHSDEVVKGELVNDAKG